MSQSELEKHALKKARRLRRSRSNPQSFWAGIGLTGSVGWLIAVPTVLGVWAGRSLDEWLETGFSFTLGLMLLGLACGGYTFWRLFIRESQ